jgi:hypothetical protein
MLKTPLPTPQKKLQCSTYLMLESQELPTKSGPLQADEAWRATNTYDIAISHNEGELYQF